MRVGHIYPGRYRAMFASLLDVKYLKENMELKNLMFGQIAHASNITGGSMSPVGTPVLVQMSCKCCCIGEATKCVVEQQNAFGWP